MITRRHIRRWLVWLGLGVGVLGIAGYTSSAFEWSIGYSWGYGERIDAARGAVHFHWTVKSPSSTGGATVGPMLGPPHWFWQPQFRVVRSLSAQADGWGYLIAPYWIFVAVGVVAAWCLLPKRTPIGGCHKCGYDLAGSFASDGSSRCPECGQVQETAT